jgi:hypothetical protein
MINPGITRHMRELDRLKTIQAVIDRVMKPGRAAERLGLSVRTKSALLRHPQLIQDQRLNQTKARVMLGMPARQMRRLVRRYRDHHH